MIVSILDLLLEKREIHSRLFRLLRGHAVLGRQRISQIYNAKIGEHEVDAILEKVRKAFNKSFDVDEGTITIETTPDDVPGWDSLGHVTLGSSLEEVFEISLDVDELMEMEDVRSIVKILQKKLGV